MDKNGIVSYQPANQVPQIWFTRERIDSKEFSLSPETYSKRKEKAIDRMQHMLRFVNQKVSCRSSLLLEYFGEPNATACGICDVCKSKSNQRLPDSAIASCLAYYSFLNPLPYSQLHQKFNWIHSESLSRVCRWMVDQELLFLYNGELHPGTQMPKSIPEFKPEFYAPDNTIL